MNWKRWFGFGSRSSRASEQTDAASDGGEALIAVLSVVRSAWPESEMAASERGGHIRFVRGDGALDLDIARLLEVWDSGGAEPDMSSVLVLQALTESVLECLDSATRAKFASEVREAVKRVDPNASFEDAYDGFVAQFLGVRRTFAEAAYCTELFGLPDDERAELLDVIVQNRLKAQWDPAESESIDRIYLRFATPSRASRVNRLVEELAAGQDKRVVVPKNLRVDVGGLPYGLEFVRDYGQHIASINDHEEGVDEKMLFAEACSNLRDRLRGLELPSEGLAVFADDADHGAACVVVLAEHLSEDEKVLVVAPGTAELLIWQADDEPAAQQARRAIERCESLAEVPIPNPVRVTRSGFTPVAWESLLGAGVSDFHVH